MNTSKGSGFPKLLPVIVAILGVCVLLMATNGLRAFTAEGARRLMVETDKPPIRSQSLTDARSGGVQLPGAPMTVISFIYTNCPTICQTGGDVFYQLQEKIKSAYPQDNIQLLTISFDPLRDDVEALETYGNAHGADGQVWKVVKPVQAQLPALFKDFGVVVIPDEYGGYQHNAGLHIVTGDGRLAKILDYDDVDGTLKYLGEHAR